MTGALPGHGLPGGTWDAGTYTIVLSSVANQGIGNLSDGFFAPQVLGLPVPSNFTCQVGAPGYQGSPAIIPVDQPFCDALVPGLNVDTAADLSGVPEPGSLSLGLLGALFFIAKRVSTSWN